MRIVLLGRFPARGEVGGVTTFTYNLARANQDIIDSVVDVYPAEHKMVPEGVRPKFITGSVPARIVKLFLLHFRANTLFHHNYSTVRGLLPLALFPKLGGSQWMLTLHNGELRQVYENHGVVFRAIIRFVLNRFNVIGSISEKQDHFYDSVTKRKKCRVSPFVEIEANAVGVSENDNVEGNQIPSFVIAGFPTRIYRHLETIRAFRELWQSGRRFRLAVCLYGFDTDGIQSEIVEEVSQCYFATLYSHLDTTAFHEILKQSDVYVRMNSVDSYGLIVAEASQYGVIAIATNVCARYPGTFLIEKDGFCQLKEAVTKIVKQEDLSELLQVEPEKQTPVNFRDLYESQLQTEPV